MICDDASKTDTHAIVAPYLADPRITFSRNAERKGIGGNWNACLESADTSARPEYIQFFFQDDAWSLDYLEKSIAALETSGADMSFAEHAYLLEGEELFRKEAEPFYESLTKARQELPAGKHDARAFMKLWMQKGLRKNIVGEPCFVMLRKTLVDRTGLFSESLRQVLDAEYWMRCLTHAQSVFFLKEQLGLFRVHAKGTSAQNNASAKRRAERWRFFLLHPILSLFAIIRN
jgi:GT2 family glycosyltransferase